MYSLYIYMGLCMYIYLHLCISICENVLGGSPSFPFVNGSHL